MQISPSQMAHGDPEMTTLITHAIALLVGLAGGGYLGYRYGARVVTDAQILKKL